MLPAYILVVDKHSMKWSTQRQAFTQDERAMAKTDTSDPLQTPTFELVETNEDVDVEMTAFKSRTMSTIND